MTAVNLNALGNLGQVNQPIATGTREKSSVKQDFEKVIKEKVGQSYGSVSLKDSEAIKPPAKKPEYKNPMSRSKSLTEDGPPKPKKTSNYPETANDIIAGAAEILNVTPEELKAVMDSLKMNAGDLTDSNNVAQLILQLNGSGDISDFLVDNGMLEAFNELNAFVAETLEESGIDANAFKDFMKNLESEETDESTDILQDEVIAASEQRSKEPDIEIEDNRENNAQLSSDRGSKTTGNDQTGDRSEMLQGFINNLEMATQEVNEIPEGQTEIRDIVYQVVNKIKVSLNADSTSLEMRLNPENLGRVSISITSKAGVMTAQINTENRQAKEAIESSLQILKENIEAKGIKVEAVEVRISDFNMADSRNSESSANESDTRGNRSSRTGRFNLTDDTEEITEEETILDPGSTVSYRA